ncbi:type III secretion system protein [Erwinia sp. E602]|uniref:FliM/FliN family flagellar motor switch protein n=1 Tax=Erwinia sp. E602 TaxID=2675378 RepID=UPI001BA5C54D|nr:FliM/FliN family flagellar motor switch protein [Erwinia sp. E602]QUG74589.1 type III secretion system protein [Erwinia sp. E602]
MSLRHYLRQYDGWQNHLKRLMSQYAGSEIINLQADRRYLSMSLTNERQDEVQAYLDVDRWLCEGDAHLPELAWQQVPLTYLSQWLGTMQLSFTVNDTVWTVQRLYQQQQALPERMLLLPAKPCPLLVTDWPAAQESSGTAGNEARTPISFRLQYVLGNSALPLSMLLDASVGDLLLIKHFSPRLVIGQRHLFAFSYQQNEEILVEQQLWDESQENRDEEETLLQWSQLPVDIEFVLDSRTVTLETLDKIAPGTVLPVNSLAEKKIKIYLNRKFFARGELVALDNGSLAVEINQINDVTDGRVGCSDVEQ